MSKDMRLSGICTLIFIWQILLLLIPDAIIIKVVTTVIFTGGGIIFSVCILDNLA